MAQTLLKRLGKAIQTRRKASGVSQESFADGIGMHRTYYGAIERGEKNIQLDTLARVCAGLNVPPWVVLREADEDQASETSTP